MQEIVVLVVGDNEQSEGQGQKVCVALGLYKFLALFLNACIYCNRFTAAHHEQLAGIRCC